MKIDVILGGSTHYNEVNQPYVIGGTPGQMDDSVMEKRTGGHDNENETVDFVEYWFEGELMHRSVNMVLKQVPKEVKSQLGKVG